MTEDRGTPKRKSRDGDDDEDDRPRKRSKRSKSSDDDGAVGYVIPYKNMMALAAYYTGIFMLIPCLFGLLIPYLFASGLLGIVPLVLGGLGLMKAIRDPKAHGSVHAVIGIGLGAVEMVVGSGGAVYCIAQLAAGR